MGKDDLKVRKQTGPAQHAHMSDKSTIISKKIEVEKLKAAMINPNQSTPKTFSTGIATELQNQDLLPYASSPKALEMRLKRAKDKEKLYPKLPSTIEEMIAGFPESLKVTQISCVFWIIYIYINGVSFQLVCPKNETECQIKCITLQKSSKSQISKRFDTQPIFGHTSQKNHPSYIFQ